jgi:hydrogenase maturation protease
MTALVICVGNLARGDDGVARRVADLLASRLPDDVTVISSPQLDVAMAEDVAAATRVIFVDAERRTAPPVATAPVAPDLSGLDVHSVSAGALVALAEQLFGRKPEALLVSVAGPKMGHGEGLSKTAEAASVEAASVVERLVSGASL